jgi:hypothetical protein
MNRTEEMIELLDRLAPEDAFSGPVDEEFIQAAEQRLEVRFPPSYRTFLARYGSGGFEGYEFQGLLNESPGPGWGDVVWLTESVRAYGLPPGLVMVQEAVDYGVMCIDTRDPDPSGEAPVIWIAPAHGESSREHDSFADFVIDCYSPPAPKPPPPPPRLPRSRARRKRPLSDYKPPGSEG